MAQDEYLHALKILRNHKVRLTPQRKTILNYLVNHHTHPSVEMIYDDLKQHNDSISIATVYNTIRLLLDYHLVIELKNGDGSTHYDYFGQPHYHVVCDNCGKITDVFTDEFTDLSTSLDEITRQQTHYLVTRNDIEVHGLCPECQAKFGLLAQAEK
ncbi:transcriptional repressor [Lactobacillus alvi]|uniref:Transcriptional repressor n=1 Tax=Limosilactobacillus alvi TaxID=990412 RepID=A0ABS2ER02_9LACO|nr:Fur family transcriptional regulator [Limosilactobacillus alvi]MBM6754786.1 transcriptional repressor [Limosilactobacillus alvi]